MPKISDKIGQRFNRLLVISKSESKSDGRTMWVCKCDCGNITEVVGSNLMSGSTQSCGCLLKETARKKGGESFSVICYFSFCGWQDMKDGYRDDLTLDRIDNNGNYEPGNCRWETVANQNKNKRPYKNAKKKTPPIA